MHLLKSNSTKTKLLYFCFPKCAHMTIIFIFALAFWGFISSTAKKKKKKQIAGVTKPFLHSETLAVPLLSDGKLPALLWSQVPSPFRRVETNSDLFHCVCLHFVTSWHLSPVSPVIRTDLSLSGCVLEIGASGSDSGVEFEYVFAYVYM